LKKGFSLIMTLAFVVIMSVIGILVSKFSLTASYHTARSFMDTRAELMLRSATEYGILALQGHKFDNKCLNSVEFKDSDNLFNIKIKYHYFVTNCSSPVFSGCECSTIQTADTNGSVLIYVTVSNDNFHVRKVKFTLQNP